MHADGAERASVRGVLGVTEFRALLSASALSTLGDQVTRLAVAVLVFEETDSAFFAAATMACSFLTWLVGGPFLSALADRWRRKRLMIWCDLLRAALVACLALPGVPLWMIFVLLMLAGALAPPFESAKSAMLPDVLQDSDYSTGNTLIGAVRQGATVSGYLIGGGLVTLISAEGALLVDAATFLASAWLVAAGVTERSASRASGTNLARETWEGFGLVARSTRLRVLLAYGSLGSIPMIAPEGLAVPVADVLGGGGPTAGLLTAALPAGFLLGSALILRVPTARRDRLLPALTALSCVPLLLSPVLDSTAGLVVLWSLAGGFSTAQLIANASYVLATPPEVRGRAFGVAASVIMATQGVVLLVVGWLAEVVDPRTAVALAGFAGLAMILPLRLIGGLPSAPDTPETPESPPFAQGIADTCRSTVG